MDMHIECMDMQIEKAHDFLQAHVRKCARCYLKLCCKLSARKRRKVRHDCTQNISKEYSNKQWSLDATVPQKVETFFIATNARCLENHCETSMISAKQILYHLWKRIYEDYSTHAESLIYMRRQQQERQRKHWEHAHRDIENPFIHPAWFLQK